MKKHRSLEDIDDSLLEEKADHQLHSLRDGDELCTNCRTKQAFQAFYGRPLCKLCAWLLFKTNVMTV